MIFKINCKKFDGQRKNSEEETIVNQGKYKMNPVSVLKIYNDKKRHMDKL